MLPGKLVAQTTQTREVVRAVQLDYKPITFYLNNLKQETSSYCVVLLDNKTYYII
jgi:hypothetical protein